MTEFVSQSITPILVFPHQTAKEAKNELFFFQNHMIIPKLRKSLCILRNKGSLQVRSIRHEV